jgi:hypothetical protein
MTFVKKRTKMAKTLNIFIYLTFPYLHMETYLLHTYMKFEEII